MSPHVRHYIWFCVVFGLISGTLFIITFPKLKPAFTDENKFLELLTAGLYIFTILIVLEVRKYVKNALARFSAALIGIYSFFWFLEESSYSRDLIYHFNRPTFYRVEVDSAHDFVSVFLRMVKKDTFEPATLGVYVFLALVIGAIVWWVYKNRVRLKQIAQTDVGVLFGFSLVAITLAAFLDLDLFGNKSTLIFLEELLEMYAALAVLYAARALRMKHLKIQEKT